jgi:transcriptional regulator with XRE-family HTH domain
MKFHTLDELEQKTSPETLDKARKLYEQESLTQKLRFLRGKYGLKQDGLAGFTQTAVSKLERRKDIKVSTLIEYLDGLGLGLEIVALPKDENAEREVLLRM